jgi:hypothetical protein
VDACEITCEHLEEKQRERNGEKTPVPLQKKKEQGFRPAPKIVSTLFSRKFGFDLD